MKKIIKKAENIKNHNNNLFDIFDNFSGDQQSLLLKLMLKNSNIKAWSTLKRYANIEC